MAMNWVMVPVPDELVPQIQVLLYQLRYKANVPQWGEDEMGEHLLTLADEPCGVLLAVAAGVVDNDPVEDVVLAEQFGVGIRELFGLVMEANDVTVRPIGGDIIHARRDEVDDGSGGTRSRRVLHMLPGYAYAAVNQGKVLGLQRRTAPRT